MVTNQLFKNFFITLDIQRYDFRRQDLYKCSSKSFAFTSPKQVAKCMGYIHSNIANKRFLPGWTDEFH